MSFNDETQKIADKITKLGLKIGFAESCTGGQLSAAFVALPGASRFFMGSVVSYDRDIKSRVLKVPLHLIQSMGEVSTPVALAMARGARELLKIDWALSITGVAGPSGGTPEKPVGTVCFGLVGPGFDLAETKYFFEGDKGGLSREAVQAHAVRHAIQLLADQVL